MGKFIKLGKTYFFAGLFLIICAAMVSFAFTAADTNFLPMGKALLLGSGTVLLILAVLGFPITLYTHIFLPEDQAFASEPTLALRIYYSHTSPYYP